jgi:hypothetical protein
MQTAFKNSDKLSVSGLGCTLKLGGLLALQFPYSKHWGLGSATHAIPLPEPKPRAMGERFVVPSIGNRDVACAEWPNIRRFEHFL